MNRRFVGSDARDQGLGGSDSVRAGASSFGTTGAATPVVPNEDAPARTESLPPPP